MAPSKAYDVVIIGAGSVGAPAAFFLAKEGLRTLVIDQFSSPGQGSNKSAIGGLRATHSDPAKIQLSLRSLDIIANWKSWYGDKLEWHKGGYVFVAYTEKDERTFKELLAIQQAFGLNIQWLEAADLLKVVPDLNPRDLIGGTFAPDDGHASPLLVSNAFYSQAKRLKAEFRFQEKAIGLDTQGGRICGVRTNKGFYGAEVVINAAGAWAADAARLAGSEVPVKPDSHEAAVTEPVARFLEPMIVDVRIAPGSSNCYFYQHDTGQVIFCITPDPSLWGYDTRETSRFLPMISQRMVNLIPRLKNLRVRRTWRGLYPMTPDGFPIVGWDREAEGYLQAVGMCGQGFMLGPGLGELLVRMIQKKTTEKDIEVLSYLSPYRTFARQEQLK